jgi:hypothetical protein
MIVAKGQRLDLLIKCRKRGAATGPLGSRGPHRNVARGELRAKIVVDPRVFGAPAYSSRYRSWRQSNADFLRGAYDRGSRLRGGRSRGRPG